MLGGGLVTGERARRGLARLVAPRASTRADERRVATPDGARDEVAGAQGKFWPMHDMLFENQDALEPEDLIAYAAVLELDGARFVRELATHAHLPKVQSDFRSGIRSGVSGTPTFFIQGVRFDQPWDVETLTEALRAAIREST